MLIFLYGKEKYLIHKRYLKLKEAFFEKNPQAVVEEFDLEENFDWRGIKESLSTGGGLFSQKKMVAWKDLMSVSDSKQELIHELLKDFKKRKDDDLILLIAEIHIKDQRGKLFQYLKNGKKAEKYDLMTPVELKKWINRQFLKESDAAVSVDELAMDRLILIGKGSLWKISRGIKKLVNFKGRGKTTVQDVDLICQGNVETKIFDLVDAIGMKNKAQALELKAQLIDQGENEFYIFSMIVFQARNLLKVDECKRKGLQDPQSISQKLSIHPFVAKKTFSQLNNFSKKELKSIYDLAAQLDKRSKTGDSSLGESLDYFIAKI